MKNKPLYIPNNLGYPVKLYACEKCGAYTREWKMCDSCLKKEVANEK